LIAEFPPCPAASRILLLESGAVALACEGIRSATLTFISLAGKKISDVNIEAEGRIVKWFAIATAAAECFIVVTTRAKRVAIVNCTHCRLLRVLDERPFPRLVAMLNDSRRIVLVTPASAKKPIVVTF
jgi:hypothetical protein